MTTKQHHLLCLGLLAKIYQQGGIERPNDHTAIKEAFQSAEKLNLPVSLERLICGCPVATNQPWDFERL